MTEIAPLRVQIADCTGGSPLGSGTGEISITHCSATGIALPVACSRSHPDLASGGGVRSQTGGEVLLLAITPHQGRQIARQAVVLIWMRIAPELRALAQPLRGVQHLAEILAEHPPAATLRAGLATAALTEIHRFVTADVGIRPGATGEKLAKQILDQRKTSRIKRTERGGFHPAMAPSGIKPGRPQLAERGVIWMAQPPFEVSETVLIRGQHHAACGGIGIQSAHFRGRQRIGIAPHRLVPDIGKCVLGIQLKMVELEPRHPVHQIVQCRHRRHPVARNIKHEPALRKGRRILDQQAGQLRGKGAQQLDERRQSPAQSGRRAGFNLHTGRRDRQPVGLPARLARPLPVDGKLNPAGLRIHARQSRNGWQQTVGRAGNSQRFGDCDKTVLNRKTTGGRI